MPRPPSYDRDALIDAARDLFWRQGWAGTSMKDLERVLKLKPGSFYAAFGSKDALYGLAMEKYASDGRSRLDHLEAAHGPLGALKQQLIAVAGGAGGVARACMLAKSCLELGPMQNPLAAQAERSLKAMEDRFAALFAKAQAQGEIAPQYDPEMLARRYQSDLMGLRITAERRDVDAPALARAMADDLDRYRHAPAQGSVNHPGG